MTRSGIFIKLHQVNFSFLPVGSYARDAFRRVEKGEVKIKKEHIPLIGKDIFTE